MSAGFFGEDIDVRLRLRDARRFQAEAKASAASVDNIGDAAARAEAKSAGASRGLIGMDRIMNVLKRTAQLTAIAVIGVGSAAAIMGINFNRSMETSLVSFEQFLGSQQQAIEFYDQLFEINKRTPFETAGINAAAAKLLGFKFTADETLQIISALGDTIAGVGGGEEAVNALSEAFGKMRAQTKLTLENLEPFTTRGVDVFGFLRDELGVSQEEVFEQITAGALKSEKFIPVILAGIARDFEGAAAKQSKTFDGMMSTLKDTAAQTFGVVTLPLFDMLRERVIPKALEFADEINTIVTEQGLGAAIDATVTRLDDMAGGTGAVTGIFNRLVDVISELWEFLANSLIPTFGLMFNVLGDVISPLAIIREIFEFLNDHTTTTRVLIIGLTAVWVTYTVAIIANTVATKANVLWTGRNVLALKAMLIIGRGAAIVTGIWTAAQWALNFALTANPIGIVIVAIAALVAGIVVAYRESETFRNIVHSVLNFIKDNWRLIVGYFLGPVSFAVLKIIQHWDEIRDAFGTAIEWIRGAVDDFIGFWTGLPGRMAEASIGLFDGVKEAFRSAINWIINAWNSLEFRIPGFDWPGPGSFPGVTVGTPDLPQLATGGVIVSPGSAIVGESGPEIVHFFQPAEVMPLGPSIRTRLSRQGDTVIPVTIELDGRVVAEVVARRAEEAQARD